MFVISNLVQFSCTDDTAATSPNTIKEKIVTNDSGDPINPTTPPRPKQ